MPFLVGFGAVIVSLMPHSQAGGPMAHLLQVDYIARRVSLLLLLVIDAAFAAVHHHIAIVRVVTSRRGEVAHHNLLLRVVHDYSSGGGLDLGHLLLLLILSHRVMVSGRSHSHLRILLHLRARDAQSAVHIGHLFGDLLVRAVLGLDHMKRVVFRFERFYGETCVSRCGPVCRR